MNKPTLLNEKQAAEFLGLSINTLRDWRWRRLGPSFKKLSPKCIRYDESDLIQWVNSNTVNALA